MGMIFLTKLNCSYLCAARCTSHLKNVEDKDEFNEIKI